MGEPAFRYEVKYESAKQACSAAIEQARREGLQLNKAQMNHYCSLKARNSKGKSFSEVALKKAFDRYYEKNS